jgi:hypothetical protein
MSPEQHRREAELCRNAGFDARARAHEQLAAAIERRSVGTR